MGKKFSRCIRRDTLGIADESYVGPETLQGIFGAEASPLQLAMHSKAVSGQRTLVALTAVRARDLDHRQWKAHPQFIVQINLNVMQSELLELHPTKIMHVRRVAFHLL